ncbi:MAG TPA: TRAP transporter TatT component family protein [Polyangia bacterium]
MQRLFSATTVRRGMPPGALVVTLVSGGLVAGCGTGRQSQWQATPVAASAALPVAPAGDAEADWNNRGDQAALTRAIATWEAQVAAKPDDGETLARLSRAYYVLADGHLRTLGPKDERYLGAFEKGVAAGERALAALSPAFKEKVTRDEKVEEAIKVVGKEGLSAMYWYAVNLGKWSRAKGIAALLGNKDRVKGVLERVLALDENFFYGAAHRYFGVYWALLPVGRDLDKSRTHFERSLALAPNYVGTKVLMAEAYAVKKQDRALFAKLLAEVQATSDDAIPEIAPETKFEKAKARELEAKIDELF